MKKESQHEANYGLSKEILGVSGVTNLDFNVHIPIFGVRSA